jgi:hypothetical protein
MPSATVPFAAKLPKTFRAERLVVALLLLAPLVSLAVNALAWLSYGIDLPYADDWRTYQDGTAYSLALGDLFTPANDTLFPVGRALDVLAMRWLAGNSVAYQFLSMIAVLGGLLFLQWRLLLSALKDRVLAAAAFSLTLFMLQPESYWGLQNLAYHQAIPVLCLLAALWIVTIPLRPLMAVPLLLCLGLISGLSYISGAFAMLTLAAVVLFFAVFQPLQRRSYVFSGSALLVAGAITTAAQIWVIVSAQQGQISVKVPWARPDELEFWAYLLGKLGRALLLPSGAPGRSLAVTALVVLLVAVIALVFLVRLVRRKLGTPEEGRSALIFVALVAVVFVYLLLVAAGRTKLRPETITAFLDIFAFGFLRFHFFWATLLWPWVGAAVVLWLSRRRQGQRLAFGMAFLLVALVLPATVWLGGFDHAASYRARMAYRLKNEVNCLEAGLQKGDGIVCVAMAGSKANIRLSYEFARRHDASFTRYFFDLRTTLPGAAPRPLTEGPVLVEQIPVGDIVAGTSIVQTVLINDDERQALASGAPVCLGLLLATYDRPNTGRARVSLAVAGATAQFDLSFATVGNNLYQSFCGALEGKLARSGEGSRELVIRVDGVEGSTGSSVTAWLTQDVSRGTAVVNGSNTGKSLLFTVAPLDKYRFGGTYSIVFYIFAIALLALCLAIALRHRPEE